MNKKTILIIVIAVLVLGAGAFFYFKGSNAALLNAKPGDSDLTKEDSEFTKKLWAEFTRRAGETPSWVLEGAIQSYEADDDVVSNEFNRKNGRPLKAGALISVIARSYEGYSYSKLKPGDWKALYEMYANWKTSLNLKY